MEFVIAYTWLKRLVIKDNVLIFSLSSHSLLQSINEVKTFIFIYRLENRNQRTLPKSRVLFWESRIYVTKCESNKNAFPFKTSYKTDLLPDRFQSERHYCERSFSNTQCFSHCSSRVFLTFSFKNSTSMAALMLTRSTKLVGPRNRSNMQDSDGLREIAWLYSLTSDYRKQKWF